MAISYKNKKNRFTRKYKGGCGGSCSIIKGGSKKKKAGSIKKIGNKMKRGGNATGVMLHSLCRTSPLQKGQSH